MLYNPKWEAPAVVETVPLEPWRRRLLDAADYIEAHGWCQGTHSDEHGKVCVVEAITLSGGINEISGRAFRALCEAVGGNYASIWNDVPGRTEAEVIATLRRVAAMEE